MSDTTRQHVAPKPFDEPALSFISWGIVHAVCRAPSPSIPRPSWYANPRQIIPKYLRQIMSKTTLLGHSSIQTTLRYLG